MRHVELLKLAEEMAAAHHRFWDAIPVQSEEVGGALLVWYPSWTPARGAGPRRLRGELRVDFDVLPGRALTPLEQARRDAVAEALRRWERNEADWPLGTLPPYQVRVRR